LEQVAFTRSFGTQPAAAGDERETTKRDGRPARGQTPLAKSAFRRAASIDRETLETFQQELARSTSRCRERASSEDVGKSRVANISEAGL
jgi:hypothetical protein